MSVQMPLSKGAAAVYTQIRQQILDGHITAGSVLQQVELAERLGVSRTPVRHALQQLAHDGLVEFLPGQTARVVSPSLQDALEMRQIRMWLEVPALLLALRYNPQPVELLNILDQIALLDTEPTPQACAQLVTLDEQFHRWLVRESGNRNLEVIVGRLLDLLFRSTPFNIAQDYKHIRANLMSLRDAIQGRDVRRVRQVMIEHMTDTGMLTIEPIGFEDVSSEW
jgi:DNA-binding GntR family transcriptional regulator